MELYAVVGSPNSRKVLAVLHHLGLPAQVHWQDFFAGDLRRPEYLALNPNGMVPTLCHGELRLWEANAIMLYLAEQVPASGLWPAQPHERADVMRWLSWELAHYNKALGVLSFEAVAKPAFLQQPGDEHLVRWAQGELARFAPVLEQALAGRTWLVGGRLTLADYAVAHLEGFQPLVPFDWAPYPQLLRYYGQMRAQPHWAATAPASPQAVGRKPA